MDPTTNFLIPRVDLDDAANIEQVNAISDRLEVLLNDLAAVEVGVIQPYAGSILPDPAGGVEYAWADGALVDKDTYGVYFGRVGHAYNGGIDPGSNKVRLPDKRGRVSIGADNYGQGAANRIPNSNRQRGQNGGEERHLLSAGESGVQSHGHGHNIATNGGGGHGHFIPRGIGGTIGTGVYSSTFDQADLLTVGDGAHNHPMQGGVSNHAGASASSGHNNMQPYEADHYIVRIK